MRLRHLLFLAFALLCAGGVVAGDYGYIQPFLNIIAPNTIDGTTINPNTGAPVSVTNLTVTGTTTDFAASSNASPYSNPLMLFSVQNVLASPNANQAGGFNLISGVAGRSIHPFGLTVMASGTMATNTGIKILCTSGNVLASIAAGNLVTSVTLAAFSSTAVNAGVAYGSGCAAGDSVYISNVGSGMTGTTNLYINIPYTVQ